VLPNCSLTSGPLMRRSVSQRWTPISLVFIYTHILIFLSTFSIDDYFRGNSNITHITSLGIWDAIHNIMIKWTAWGLCKDLSIWYHCSCASHLYTWSFHLFLNLLTLKIIFI
jgi:hypothetical protein